MWINMIWINNAHINIINKKSITKNELESKTILGSDVNNWKIWMWCVNCCQIYENDDTRMIIAVDKILNEILFPSVTNLSEYIYSLNKNLFVENHTYSTKRTSLNEIKLTNE